MKLNYKKSQSTICPELIDTTSSNTTVYLRKDIVKNIIESEEGNITIIYDYDEAKLTNAEYEEYLNELSIIDIQQQRADIDYIAMMAGIELEVSNE